MAFHLRVVSTSSFVPYNIGLSSTKTEGRTLPHLDRHLRATAPPSQSGFLATKITPRTFKMTSTHSNAMDPDEIESPEREMYEAACTLYDMRYGTGAAARLHQNRLKDSDTELEDSDDTDHDNDRLSPPTSMFSNMALGAPWFHDLLRCQPLRDFVQFGLRTSTLVPEAEIRVAAVVAVMDARSCVQEACWYLEDCDWSVTDAIGLYYRDERRRESRKQQLQDEANCRAWVVNSTNFNLPLLNFHLNDANNVKSTIARFAKPRDFDRSNANHTQALTQWLNDLTRTSIGPPTLSNSEPFPSTLAKYSTFENRFLNNRFESKISGFHVQTKKAAIEEITAEFNALFVGRYLPHAASPCGVRRVESVNEHIRTELIGRKTDDRDYSKATASIQRTREEEQAEFDRLMAGLPAKQPDSASNMDAVVDDDGMEIEDDDMEVADDSEIEDIDNIDVDSINVSRAQPRLEIPDSHEDSDDDREIPDSEDDADDKMDFA